MQQDRTFVGFGFGAIQAGLFVYEAWRTGNFGRMVVAEVVPALVDGVRRHGGRYALNVATPTGVETHQIGPIEILNPLDEQDRPALIKAVAEAAEMATALPSVTFYGTGKPGDTLDILTAGLRNKIQDARLPAAVIYTAENHNHAAEILSAALESRLHAELSAARTQVLNTVIGKMSGVVVDAAQIAEQNLLPAVPGMTRAFLVEAFNRILITRIGLPGFRRGIGVFEEKADLLPFEEAKLYGHNATHALIGYLLRESGGVYMSEAAKNPALLKLAREAFLYESGEALCRKYRGKDPLFTQAGYMAYADDLLVRMTNPFLKDAVDRVARDTRRKLGWEDRLIGTMRLALGQGIQPVRYARGAAAAVRQLALEEQTTPADLLENLWKNVGAYEAEVRHLVEDTATRVKGVKTQTRENADGNWAK
jgi:mannitol-1-phosphate/altronate dehydrogenase